MNSAFPMFPTRNDYSSFRLVLLGVALSVLTASTAFAEQTTVTQSSIAPAQSSASAWEAQALTLTATKQSFANVIATLSTRLGCAIVADGKPALEEADFDLHGSAKEVLDAITDKFDYSWRVNKNGVVLLTKRFTTEIDVPQMNLAEMTQMSADFARLLPDTGIALDQIMLPLNALYRTFTPEQMTLLQGRKRIEFTHLLPEQQKLVHLAVVNNMFGDGRSQWEHLHDMLAALPRAKLIRRPCVIVSIVKRASLPPELAAKPEQHRSVVTDSQGHVREDLTTRNESGEELVYVWQDAQGQEQTLSLFRQATAASPTPPTNQSVGKQDSARKANDDAAGERSSNATGTTREPQTASREGQEAAAGSGLNAPVHLRLGRTTLERLAVAVEEQTGVHVLVPRWLRERQIIAQIDGVSVRMALDALAELDGWHVTVFDSKAVGLGRSTVSNVQDMSELPAALNGVAPADFRQFLRVPATLPQGPQRSAIYYKDAVGKKVDIGRERSNAGTKLQRVSRQRMQSLFMSIQSRRVPSETFFYMQLAPVQREYLTEALTAEGLSKIFDDPTRGSNLLYGLMYPYQQDETKAYLTLSGAEILVNAETTIGTAYVRQGFGEPIHSPEKLRDPLHFGRP